MEITAITGSQRQNGNTSSAVQVLFSIFTDRRLLEEHLLKQKCYF